MGDNLKLTVLIENSASLNGFLGEHGLSFWVEYAGRKVLFDTGQTERFIKNARVLKVDLAKADAIVLSHGHYDHSGGLKSSLEIAKNAMLYMHPSATEKRFSKKDFGAKPIGMADEVQEAVRQRNAVCVMEPAEVFAGITATGQVPRLTDFEDVGGPFFIDKDLTIPDNIPDDQSLFVETEKGLVVIFGCAHSGVVNTLDYVSAITGKDEIYAVIGGMHLVNADDYRIARTIEAFKKYGVQKLLPMHCSGEKAVEAIQLEFGDKCISLGAGGQINF